MLVEAGIQEADMLIAVTAVDEVNMITCMMAKHLGVYKTVAQLSKAAYIPVSQAIGVVS